MHSQCLLLAEQALVSGHLSLTALVASYENHSRKRPAPVTDTFFASRGCPLTRASDCITFTFTRELILLLLCNMHVHESCYKFCPRDMSHEVQLVEPVLGHVAGTKLCKDEMPLSCARLFNIFLQQNQSFSQSQTTNRILRAVALGKTTWGPSIMFSLAADFSVVKMAARETASMAELALIGIEMESLLLY